MVFHISYISRASDSFSQEELIPLEKQASSANENKGITGVLIFDGSHFFQYIEGNKADIEALYQKIEKDKRHASVTELSSGEVSEKLFPNWGMKSFLPGDFVAEDRVHILDILSENHEKESVPEILRQLRVRQATA